MVKDTLNSMLDNIKERTTNPFLGTLLVVWLVKNWTLVYSLFYFDNSLKLSDRLKYISSYFSEHSFILNMVFVILITLGVLVLTYILLSLSRLVTDAQERIIVPIISKWTDKSSIVLKTEYVKLQEIIKQLEMRLEEERLAKVAIQNERERLEQRLADRLNTESTETSDKPDENKASTLMERIVRSFIDQQKVDHVNGIITAIQMEDSIVSGDEVVKKLLINDFIKYDRSDARNDNYAFYTLTSLGKAFLRYWNESTMTN